MIMEKQESSPYQKVLNNYTEGSAWEANSQSVSQSVMKSQPLMESEHVQINSMLDPVLSYVNTNHSYTLYLKSTSTFILVVALDLLSGLFSLGLQQKFCVNLSPVPCALYAHLILLHLITLVIFLQRV
jgi:hypothetical protein